MFRVERQYKHHVPQSDVDLLRVRLLAIAAINWNRLFVTVLVVNVNRRESLSESLYLKVHFQQSSHFFSGKAYRFQTLLARGKS